MFKNFWHDPVWSKVIAAAVIGAAGVAWVTFEGAWPAIVSWSKETISLAKWESMLWLILLPIASFVGGCLIANRFFRVHDINPKSEMVSVWRSYLQDEFFSLRWRWKYAKSGYIESIKSFCPTCDLEIVPQYKRGNRPPNWYYQCDTCDELGPAFAALPDQTKEEVRRLIEQKLRNDARFEDYPRVTKPIEGI